MTFVSWCMALALSALPSFALAVSGNAAVEGRVVPLPPGEWREVGRATEVANLRYSGQQYRLGKALFIQESNGRATAMTVVWAASSNPGTSINWDVPATCRREDVFAQMTRSADHRAMDCLVVGTLLPMRRRPENVPDEWRSYFTELEARPEWIPHTWAFASFRLSDPFNLLHVEYRFSPEAQGFGVDRRAWSANGWNYANLDDRRRGFLERVRVWASLARSTLWQGFQRGAPVSLPAP